MIRSETLERRLGGYDKTLLEWARVHPAIQKSFPDNCEVQFFRLEEGALRLLASAIYIHRVSSCWLPYEAANERQEKPDLVVCREWRPAVPEGLRITTIWPTGEVDWIDVSDEETRYDFFSLLHGLTL